MNFDFGYGTAKYCNSPAPTVFFTFVNLGGVHAFQASQVIDAARLGKSFQVAPLSNDEPLMSINAEKLKELALWVEAQTVPDGKFMTVWVPFDHSTPF